MHQEKRRRQRLKNSDVYFAWWKSFVFSSNVLTCRESCQAKRGLSSSKRGSDHRQNWMPVHSETQRSFSVSVFSLSTEQATKTKTKIKCKLKRNQIWTVESFKDYFHQHLGPKSGLFLIVWKPQNWYNTRRCKNGKFNCFLPYWEEYCGTDIVSMFGTILEHTEHDHLPA